MKDLLQHINNGVLIFCVHLVSPKKCTRFSGFAFHDILITCSMSHVMSLLKAYLSRTLHDYTKMLLVYNTYSLEVPCYDFKLPETTDLFTSSHSFNNLLLLFLKIKPDYGSAAIPRSWFSESLRSKFQFYFKIALKSSQFSLGWS